MSIELHNVSKSFNKRGRKIHALDDISLKIKQGEFLGLLGPNGAGKTTLTKILSTLLLPTSGEAYINDIPITEDKKIRKIISTAFGESGGRSLYYRLSIEDNLRFYATLAGVQKKEAQNRIAALLKYFDLEEKRKTLVMKLSTGMKAKVVLIRSLIPLPQVLLLDEPTLGFDAISSEKAKNLLTDFNKEFGITILLTSHNFSEIDALTRRIILIDQGKMVEDCAPFAFKKVASQELVDVIFSVPNFQKEIFSEIIRQVAHAKIIRLVESTNYVNSYEAQIQSDRYPLNETISLITVLILERGGKVFKIAPFIPSLKESFLAFLKIKEEQEKETILSIPIEMVE